MGPLVAGHHGVPHVVPPLPQAEDVILPAAGSHDDVATVASSVTRWIRADFPPKIMKFPQFFPTILRIPNFFVKFPKPKKVGFMILDCLEIVAYGAKAL